MVYPCHTQQSFPKSKTGNNRQGQTASEYLQDMSIKEKYLSDHMSSLCYIQMSIYF